MPGLRDSWGTGPLDLRRELADSSRARVRRRLIAAETATEVECPHCSADIGAPCVTFPRGTEAQHTHMARVNRRLVQVEEALR